MEAQSIVLIVGVAVLLLERIFACLNRVKKSKCCGGEIELTSLASKKSLNDSATNDNLNPNVSNTNDNLNQNLQ
jgi:iron-sulfur cluster repair protein YtfE (RIC family)